MPVGRLTMKPKLPPSSWWASRTTLRWKKGSRTWGMASSRTGAVSSDPALDMRRSYYL
jgi:hypothetical protein